MLLKHYKSQPHSSIFISLIKRTKHFQIKVYIHQDPQQKNISFSFKFVFLVRNLGEDGL